MSRQKGKREAERETWHKGGDPFASDTPKRKKGKGLTGWKRTVAIVLGCVAVLVLAVVGLWKTFVVSPDVSDKIKPTNTDTVNTEEAEKGDEPSTTSGRKVD